MLGTTAASWVFSTGVACFRSDEPAAANVTVDNVNAYIAELKDQVSSVTLPRLDLQVAARRQVHVLRAATSPGSPRSPRTSHWWRGHASSSTA